MNRSIVLIIFVFIAAGCVSAPPAPKELPAKKDYAGKIVRIRALVGEKWTDDEAMRIRVHGLIESYGFNPKDFRLIESRVEENEWEKIYEYDGFATVVFGNVFGKKTVQEIRFPNKAASLKKGEFPERRWLPLDATDEERQMMREAVACASFEEAFKLLIKK